MKKSSLKNNLLFSKKSSLALVISLTALGLTACSGTDFGNNEEKATRSTTESPKADGGEVTVVDQIVASVIDNPGDGEQEPAAEPIDFDELSEDELRALAPAALGNL